MIPVAFYLSIPPVPGLLLGFTDFRLEVAAYLGYGVDESLWETDFPGSTDELYRSVNEAYRWVLYPQTLPTDRINHVWSFLQQDGTLTLVADQSSYDVPTNFGSFFGDRLRWDESISGTSLIRTSMDEINRKRQYYGSSTTRPTHFAVVWSAPSYAQSQVQKIVIYPTPSEANTLHYRYAINVDPMSVSNPYPVGGQRISQLIMEAAKAVGEAKKDGRRGDQWNIFRDALDSAIRMDKSTQTEPTMGFMRESRPFYVERDLGSSRYFAPDVTGSYVLVEGL